MTASPITAMRTAVLFKRTTALTVAVAFLMLILQPTVVAAQNNHPPQTANTPSNSRRFSDTLQQIEAQLERVQEKIAQQQDSAAERGSLKQLHQTLKQLDSIERQSFADTEQRLKDKKLPAEILGRQQAMVDNYAAEYAALDEALNAVEAASSDSERSAPVQTALERLKAKPNKRVQQPFDPNQLPNRSLQADPNRKPKESAEQFTQAQYFDTPYAQLAALGDFTYAKLAGADNPAYLAESDEVVISEAIKAKAAELQYDPVKIYHWVRNNVVWLPSWGALQNADLTLSALRGNAMDIASLTIALLRAAKIPARYVYGSIDVPADQFSNWAGGFATVEAAGDYASTGGIPVTNVISGGKVTKVRIEHVWVEAAIDFHPSRGAKNKDADSWVGLDPSYKQYDHLKGLDAVAISGIDADKLAQDFIDSGTVNEAESWATGFNGQILQDAQTQAQQKLEDYVDTQMQNPTVGDVIGGAKTIIQEYPVLPGSLPNRIVTTGVRYDKLPVSLQQTIRYAFAKDLDGSMLDPVSFPFAKVNNAKLTLSFKPATDADEQTLESLLPEGEITDINQLPGSIPSYLISVIPELKLNGETVKTGSTMKLGEELPFTTAVSFAGRGEIQSPRTYNVIAGSYLSVNAIAGNVSPDELDRLKTTLESTKAKLESNDQAQIAALTREELLGDLFRTGTLGYYAQMIGLTYVMGIQTGGHHQLAAGTGTVGYEPYVDYFFGIPRAIEPGGVVFDIPLVNISGMDDGDAAKKTQFVMQYGILSSALEHAMPEQMFVNDENPGEAISAVKALQKANDQGQKIYQITQANQNTTLSNIHHDSATMAEISNALGAGKEVITHTDAVSVPGWSGAGYIIYDTKTGDGAYKIAGGGNGSFFSGLSAGISGGAALTLVLYGLMFGSGVFIFASILFFLSMVSLAISIQYTYYPYNGECYTAAYGAGMVAFFDAVKKMLPGEYSPLKNVIEPLASIIFWVFAVRNLGEACFKDI